MFEALLPAADARRATTVLDAVLAHGLRCGLAGSLAIDCQLRAQGREVARRRLGDIDLVVRNFSSIPESMAGSFLFNHVHPNAVEEYSSRITPCDRCREAGSFRPALPERIVEILGYR